MWRRVAIDAIRNDPAWQGGRYSAQPGGLRVAAGMLALVASNPVLRQRESPTLAAADAWFTSYVDTYVRTADASDVLYALEASWDYDPAPTLERITAPLVAVNFADDLVNPPELGILEREITRVPRGRAVVLPSSEQTRGHGSHTIAALWTHLLGELLAASSGAAAT
jgi:homoserine O-acetyltransferase